MATQAADILCACPQEMGMAWNEYTSNSCGVGSLWQLGVVANDETATELANGASEMGRVKGWDDTDLFGNWEGFDTTKEDGHCDDCVGPKEIEEFFRRQQAGKCFAESITARWCKGCDDETAIDAVFDRVNVLRQHEYEKRVMSTMIGIYLGEAAGNGAAATDSIITDLTADPYGLGARLNRLNLIKADGEKDCQELDGMIVHPTVYSNKKCEGYVECPCDEEGKLSFLQGPNQERIFRAPKHLKGKLDLGSNQYLSIGYRDGIIRYGEGCVDNPVNRFYDNCRKAWFIDLQNRFVIHPAGFNWNEDTVTVDGLALADLEAAANWARLADCESSGLQFYISDES